MESAPKFSGLLSKNALIINSKHYKLEFSDKLWRSLYSFVAFVHRDRSGENIGFGKDEFINLILNRKLVTPCTISCASRQVAF